MAEKLDALSMWCWRPRDQGSRLFRSHPAGEDRAPAADRGGLAHRRLAPSVGQRAHAVGEVVWNQSGRLNEVVALFLETVLQHAVE